ncbi:FecR family protein [Dyadobacter sp. CY347]|uniref:FecR family protein n=1 Tax=Dyadobacter sp. CY347 TaxID=2909336 RepID=UPI001F172C5A|nr:FecR family protein [Dyadobacter sp. CY347]MCF2489255.1 FecR family protein [Dyadobacter sp. CY347]
MNNYKNFELKDWVEDPGFRRWVYRGEDDAYWTSVLKNTPLQAENIEQAREILLMVRGEADEIPEQELASRKANILDYISQETQIRSWWRRSWLQVAAVLLLTMGFGGYYYKRHSQPPYNAVLAQSGSRIIEIVNTNEAVKLVTLPDGSSVILKKAAKISYPASFATDKREVVMLGEAFFEVQKNPEQPFFIYAGEMLTQVTGTSFSIKANAADKQVQLVVKTGVVDISVIRAGNEAGNRHVILNPNQLVTLDRNSSQLAKKDVDEPVLIGLPIESQYFKFKKTPVKDVFLALEQAYGVHIHFDKQVTSRCNITAKLGDEPIREKMQMICEVIGAKFEMQDNAIAVFSNGCDITD